MALPKFVTYAEREPPERRREDTGKGKGWVWMPRRHEKWPDVQRFVDGLDPAVEKIAVVEDDPGIRTVIRLVLKGVGFVTVCEA